jgi:hypothetical protein
MTRFDAIRLKQLIKKHLHYTNSDVARRILDDWANLLPKFVKVMPVDYRNALEQMQSSRAGRRASPSRIPPSSRRRLPTVGKPTGFMEYERVELAYEPAADRVVHYNEFALPLSDAEIGVQGARCMDCGIPYCHQGCPVNNIIPDWNDLVYRQDWQAAIEVLHSTNNFPEFTGRICPAPCEASCTLNIDDKPVAIKAIERAIADKAWEEGWVKPQVPMHRTGKRVAVVGSGPAGLACAQQLARAGHAVSLYEKEDRIGGLLRYGIPDFKLAKKLIDRRMSQMRAEGVEFHTHCHIGVDIPVTSSSTTTTPSCSPAARRSPRPRRARAQLQRHPFRHGLPARQLQARAGRLCAGRRLHQRPRQARRRHRRRRHRLRLHRHLQPPRRRPSPRSRSSTSRRRRKTRA